MKVVIVGCGWLGAQLAGVLRDAGHQVFASRRQQPALADIALGIRPIQLDLATPQVLPEVYAALHQATVICTIPPGRRSDSASDYQATLTRLSLLMQQAGSLGVIHFSSSGIYQGLSGDVDEQTPLLLGIERVAMLAQGEAILQRALPLCVTLRLGGLMGPGRHPGRFVAGRTLANPEGHINMLHADDACAAVLCLLRAVGLQSATYNLCSPEGVTRRVFYQAAAKALATALDFSDDSLISHRALAQRFIKHFGFQYRFASPVAALTYCD